MFERDDRISSRHIMISVTIKTHLLIAAKTNSHTGNALHALPVPLQALVDKVLYCPDQVPGWRTMHMKKCCWGIQSRRVPPELKICDPKSLFDQKLPSSEMSRN